MRLPPVRKVPLPHGLPMVDRHPAVSHALEQGLNQLQALFVPKRFKNASPPASTHEDIAPAIPTSLLKAEVEALPPEQVLVCSGHFRVSMPALRRSRGVSRSWVDCARFPFAQ